MISGEDGATRIVHYQRAPAASTPLLVGGVALSTAGVVVAVAGVVTALSNLHIDVYGCGGDPGGEAEREKNRPSVEAADRKNAETSRTLGGIGAAMIVVGAVAIVVGALNSSSSMSVSSPAVPRAATRPRAPTWARAELPPPPNHTTLLEVRF